MVLSPLDRAIIKASYHFLPILLICYILVWSNRTNFSLVKLKIINDLPAFQYHTETIFGLSQALYYVGLLILQIPSVIIVEKWSARKWFCSLPVIWGLFASLIACVTQPWHLCVLSFFLAIPDSGYFTSVAVYLSRWFPRKSHTSALSFIFLGIPIALMINPKISYLFLRMGTTEDGIYYRTLLELRGWQWM